jgi:hypothetical protein
MANPPEGERRKPRPASLSMEDILAVFQRDQDRHMNSGPSTQTELGHLEAGLGTPLPPSFRSFLMRLGGGLFYNGHEIFGPTRCMVHDIDLRRGSVMSVEGGEPYPDLAAFLENVVLPRR